jgi:hypothetical protein
MRRAELDLAVGGYHFTGPDHEPVASFQLRGRNLPFGSIGIEHACVLRPSSGQLAGWAV